MMTIAVTEFKAKCLSLMEQVRETRMPLTVTKRGRQFVRIVPVPDESGPPSLKGTIVFQADDLTSTGESWEADES